MRPAVGILYALLLSAGAVLVERPQQHASHPVLFDRRAPAVVFTAGKVGSTTIARSLAVEVYFQGNLRYRYLTGTPQKWPLIVKTHMPSVAADFIKARGSHAGPVWVFAAVRQPFTRLVSNYFEAIETGGYRSRERTLAMSMREMREDFLAWVNKSRGAGCHPFFHGLRQVVGVNLADYAFPFEEGKLMVKSQVNSTSLVVALLRFEDIARWGEIMRENVPWWRDGRFHVQDSRLTWYSDKYKEFSRYLKWPRAKADELMKCDHFHFYSPAERAAFYQHAVGDGPPPRVHSDGVAQLEVDGRPEALFTFGGGAMSDD
uniref:Sulfotransferase domain-containing protein n=1 Tax=Alexandrium catenella TaxID=2925 RepID=A0A7S1WSW6_ALECA|mmetsp:Transcript_86781/g.230586  ORF Transcript_86781/g.230586 Transcript_86781/m.230586 type:complete len:317 (+) Transcript_86781:42-992(+)|eukprot:CAMPEP_0171196378 /NCGR_PEP_ID=MMETSP0790-20130122/21872_1 /TAXON_ID=2925 /ORGANISM="Alexandrium catenella, Strain OF101" /LENGTH=316 /DNA_ID=CAMNT_0011661601 /DNA_START=30 /DNA_END=980 /DNA_ORIENTATION=+